MGQDRERIYAFDHTQSYRYKAHGVQRWHSTRHGARSRRLRSPPFLPWGGGGVELVGGWGGGGGGGVGGGGGGGGGGGEGGVGVGGGGGGGGGSCEAV
jgi:hypothetical protein